MQFSQLFSYCPVCGSGQFLQNNIKSKKCVSCGFVLYVNASAAVAGFIVNENNELLVCVRGREPEKGMLDLPGGFVDDNETAEEAVVREIMEELNVKVESVFYLFSLPNTYKYSGFTLPTLDLFYEIKVADLSTLRASDDVEEVAFLPFNKIDKDKFGLASIKKAIEIYKRDKMKA